MIPKPTVRPTGFQVSCLPPESVNYDVMSIEVAWRGDDRFAVLRNGMCLSSTGVWDYEPIPSNREEAWLIAHRFDLETALRLAKEQAPLITISGHTVADVLARER